MGLPPQGRVVSLERQDVAEGIHHRVLEMSRVSLWPRGHHLQIWGFNRVFIVF